MKVYHTIVENEIIEAGSIQRIELPYERVDFIAIHCDNWNKLRDVSIKIHGGAQIIRLPTWFCEKFFIPLFIDGSQIRYWCLELTSEVEQKVSVMTARGSV